MISASLAQERVGKTWLHLTFLFFFSQKSDSHLPDFGMFIPHCSFITQDCRADQRVNVLTRNSVVVTPHKTQRETCVTLGWINIGGREGEKKQGALFITTLPHTLTHLLQ